MTNFVSISLLTLLITFLGGVSYAVAHLAFVRLNQAIGCVCLGILWLFPFLFSFFIPGSILIVLGLAWLSYYALTFFHSQNRTKRENSLSVLVLVHLPASALCGSLYYLTTSEGRLKLYRDEPAAMCAAILCPLLFALLHWLWGRNRLAV
jgi:hypothetical protein